ncbi:hypothetical protein EDD15DRAFT_2362815 [Pisolithus albus]|nr:hypothetical protein EDD15DRAFT_2362815 [Pisolithus albus]
MVISLSSTSPAMKFITDTFSVTAWGDVKAQIREKVKDYRKDYIKDVPMKPS